MINKAISTTQRGRGDTPREITRLTHTQHALGNKSSLRKAVNAKCWDCCGGGLTFKESKGVRVEIKNCQVTDCSLFNFRPYKNNKHKKTTVRLSPARGFHSSKRTNEVNQL